MITKVIEKISKSKINKIPLFYSQKFDNYLTNIISINRVNDDSTDNIDIINFMELSESDISFIDTSDLPDTIVFTPANKVLKEFIKNEKFDTTKFKKWLSAHAILEPYTSHIKNYEGPWTQNRVEMKIGKFVKKITNLTDKEIEEVVNQYKSLYKTRKNTKFEFIKGDEIETWYDQDNYLFTSEVNSDGIGTLGKSCMRHGYSNFFDLYTQNPDVCSLMILKSELDDSKIIGRALVWKLSDGSTYLDRIYTHFDSDINLFRNYAKQNGWKTHFEYKEKILKDDAYFSVNLTNVDFDYYPYGDTFYIIDLDTKKAHSNKYYKLCKVAGLSENLIQIRNTDGSH